VVIVSQSQRLSKREMADLSNQPLGLLRPAR
jgi:hypothetical protein